MIMTAQSMPPREATALVEIYGLLERAPSINTVWHYTVFAQLRNLEEAGANRPGLGDLRVAERTSSHVRRIVAQINIADLPTPEVAPISGGGIAVTWDVGNREVQLAAFADGEVVCLTTENGAILEEPEGPSGAAPYTAALNWLLGRPA
jgi:hypothetical protein